MYDLLFKNIEEYVRLTEDEKAFCKTLYIPKKLRKRRFLLQEGDVCKYTAFVEKGMLRTYSVDEKGNEHILQFAMEGWWAADLYSFLTKESSPFNIEALEECELLLITSDSWEVLLKKVPVLERYFRIVIQNNLIATQRRLIGAISETAEEKYLKLINNFPGCLNRIPQHMIASFLGITPETLSRVRSKIADKKPP